jgi:polyisoprenoid-binding protein YceI
LSICVFLFTLAYSDNIKETEYQLDKTQSEIKFKIKNFGLLTVEGKFEEFSGSIKMATDFEKSQVNANVNISSINTENKSRDEHLRSKDFFETSKYPLMVFKSTNIKGNIENFKMEGDLTIKGITKKVTFDCKSSATNTKEDTAKQSEIFNAEAIINRKDFSIEHGSTIGDEVKIYLKIKPEK